MSSTVDLKTKEEKDAELDKRIEALRKKNEALVKRYQEIQEDKKKAEQEGIAITTPRKPRPLEPEPDRRKTEKENFTVTVDISKPAGEKRVVNDWKPATPRPRKTSEENDDPKGPSDDLSTPRRAGSGRVGWGGQRGGGGGRGGGGQERRNREPRPPREGEPGELGGQGRRGGRRGRGGGRGGGEEGTPGGTDRKSKEWEEKRRQNIEKMNEEMERIAEYERGQRTDGDKPIRNFLDDPRRSGPVPDSDRKEGSRRHVRNWGGLDFDNVKTGNEVEREWTSRRPGPKGSVDMTMSMTGRERAEYLRWKKEREQIDEERLARHRNATGQWRREWDAQKTENMFKEDPCAEGVTPEQGVKRERERNAHPKHRGGASDDSKRPPKAPTFGDFLSQGRTQGPRGDRNRGKGQGPKQNYSMHDNRWEGEKEEEEKEKEDKSKTEVKTKKKTTEENPKPPSPEKAQEKNEDEECDDDDEWEDASEDGEVLEERVDPEQDSRSGENKDTGKEKRSWAASPKHHSRTTSAGSPKEQRTPRPKVHIPPPPSAQEASEGGKPLSPFYPLEGHHPVSDWGEEMEMLSPRSSVGGESPPKPSSTESSPPQKKEVKEEEDKEEEVKEEEDKEEEVKEEEDKKEEVKEEENKEEVKEEEEKEEEEKEKVKEEEEEEEDKEEEKEEEDKEEVKEEEEEDKEEEKKEEEEEEDKEENKEEEEKEEEEESRAGSSSEPTELQKEQTENTRQTVTVSEPEGIAADSSDVVSSDPASSEVSDPAPSEVSESDETTDPNTNAAPSQGDKPGAPPAPPAVAEAEQSSSEVAAGEDNEATPAGSDGAPTEEAEPSSEPTSSG